ncbi:MAG: non-ribosomal peptide synthetase, partial [Clostridia bacterium]|nr:non-ribosomal peptide synthetase [Clostridia bacterium]
CSLPPLDSAAITYLPDNNQIWPDLFYDEPIMYKHMSLGEGNIGVIAIPLGINQLYNENEKAIKMCVEAVRLAESAGARTVSLTGLIPSATDTGRAIEEAVKKSGLKTLVTTGHSTTTATVILSIIRILGESNRNLADENVCVLGIGSIGSAVAKLMIAMLPHPKSIVLCDLPSRMVKMQELRKELINEFGFMTNINLAYSDGTRLPDEVYKSTFIIGATNAPDVLDIEQLDHGTIIVDDSGPHCFSTSKAIERISSSNDLIITEGGVLEVPGSIKNKLYLPLKLDNSILSRFKSHFMSDKQITGCILSGLLSSTNKNINSTTGNVDINECIKNYQELIKSGYRGAELHFEDFVFSETLIRTFKANYANSRLYGKPIDK